MKTAKTVHVANIVPALTARTQLGQILRRVRQNKERFVIDKRGEPQAIIISVEEYLRNFVKAPRTLTKIRRSLKNKRTKPISLRTINMEIKKYRKERRQKDD